tara:strand:+ start:172 stop:540 length:369 start_codon:yes stop_codon:yes gene_type:complete
MEELNVGKDFSTDPCGRYYSDNTKSSGEQFREEALLPRLRNLNAGEKLDIVLDENVESYGSSFLTEGFAGVVKYGYMRADELVEKINLIVKNDMDFEYYRDKIIQYIHEAKYDSKKYVSTRK